MGKNTSNVVRFADQFAVNDPLTELLSQGARELIY